MTFQQSPLGNLQSKHSGDTREAGNSALTGATRSLKRCQLQLCDFDEEIERELEKERRRQMERAFETVTE